MNSMKTLAYTESQKLARFIDLQHAVVRSINEVAADFLSFHPETLPEVKETVPIYLLIGTERGFCGDFHHALLRDLETALTLHPPNIARVIAIGRKLHALLEGDMRVVSLMDGASVIEEVTSLLNQLVSILTTLQDKHGVLTVYCLYHGSEENTITQKLLPPFQPLLHAPPRFPHPPILNQPPREFLVELTDH